MASQFQAILSNVEKKLNEKNKFTDYLAQAEAKTGVKRLYLVSGKHHIIHSFERNGIYEVRTEFQVSIAKSTQHSPKWHRARESEFVTQNTLFHVCTCLDTTHRLLC